MTYRRAMRVRKHLKRRECGEALANVRRLEQSGLLLYSQEVVCPFCDGATELAFINVTWAREMITVGQEEARL